MNGFRGVSAVRSGARCPTSQLSRGLLTLSDLSCVGFPFGCNGRRMTDRRLFSNATDTRCYNYSLLDFSSLSNFSFVPISFVINLFHFPLIFTPHSLIISVSPNSYRISSPLIILFIYFPSWSLCSPLYLSLPFLSYLRFLPQILSSSLP